MKVTVTPSTLQGSIEANVSKSYAQRAYAIAALSSSSTRISRTSWSDDAIAALRIAQNLGAEIIENDGVVTIEPNKMPVTDSWYVGEAGLSLRMFSAIAASLDRTIRIDGHGSLRGRPTEFITEVLTTMSAEVVGDSLPLTIHGPMVPGRYGVDGSFSSQLITGLLIALPLLDGDTELMVINLTSTPYIDMTLEMMRLFGVEIRCDDYRTFKIRGGQQYVGADLAIEADWSGLAFILVAGAIAGDPMGSGEVTIKGVARESSQADRAIVDVLHTAGCQVTFGSGVITVKSSVLNAFSFDATHCPDLIPPLSVLATQCVGESRIKGINRLQHKESDRGMTLSSELGKLGVKMKIEGDDMSITGKQMLEGAEVDACGDHRIAMALVCAGLVAQGDTKILGAECISKSYHDFYLDIRNLGGKINGDNNLFIRRYMKSYLK